MTNTTTNTWPAPDPVDHLDAAIAERCKTLGLTFKPAMRASVRTMIEDEIGDGHFDLALQGWGE